MVVGDVFCDEAERFFCDTVVCPGRHLGRGTDSHQGGIGLFGESRCHRGFSCAGRSDHEGVESWFDPQAGPFPGEIDSGPC